MLHQISKIPSDTVNEQKPTFVIFSIEIQWQTDVAVFYWNSAEWPLFFLCLIYSNTISTIFFRTKHILSCMRSSLFHLSLCSSSLLSTCIQGSSHSWWFATKLPFLSSVMIIFIFVHFSAFMCYCAVSTLPFTFFFAYHSLHTVLVLYLPFFNFLSSFGFYSLFSTLCFAFLDGNQFLVYFDSAFPFALNLYLRSSLSMRFSCVFSVSRFVYHASYGQNNATLTVFD